jgi:hypothetical protein
MADTNGPNNNNPEVGVEDLVPVRSRVSWAAVLAGSMIALAVYLVLTLFAGAIGLSLTDVNVRSDTWTTVAVVAAVFCMIAALFVGGWVTTQLSVGENKTEAVIHGVLTWGVVFAITVWLVGMGVKTGYNAMVGAAYVSRTSNEPATANQDWRTVAYRAGVPAEDIRKIDQNFNVENMSNQARDPANQQAAIDTAEKVTWWTLIGTLLAIASAVGGALVGAGPTFRLVRVPAARMTRTETRATFTAPAGR